MQNDFPMVRQVPFMGVIWVVNEAMKLGFWNGNPEWCNLGQGQPEVGELEGAPERISSLAIQPGDHVKAYAYTDLTAWSDTYAYFGAPTATAVVNAMH